MTCVGFLLLCFLPSKSQEPKIKTCSGFSYKIQKYTGLNFIADFFTEAIIKGIIKIKTKAKELNVDLQTYCASDLIKKKARSLEVSTKNLFIKDVPIEIFQLKTSSPVYFKKNKVLIPLQVDTFLKVDLTEVTHILNNLPKWKKVLGELDIAIPPFGETKVKINDLKIKINENGLVQVNTFLSSVINPDAEPLNLSFTGNLTLEEEKLIVKDLKSQIEDLFTDESEIADSFSIFLEDLINPVFNFHKLERNGLKIESIKLDIKENALIFNIMFKLLPEENR